MSALAQPSFDNAEPVQATGNTATPFAPRATVVELIAAARVASLNKAPATAAGFVHDAPVLVSAPASEEHRPVAAPAVESQAIEPVAPAQPAVADQKSLLQFVASTKGADAEAEAAAADVSAACVIPQAITFKGEAEFPCDAVIEGEFQGSLRVASTSRVSIAKTGMVEGEISGHSVHVDGSVSGEIRAIGGLASFGPKAFCSGQIHYTRLSIEEGAEIEASMKRVTQAA